MSKHNDEKPSQLAEQISVKIVELKAKVEETDANMRYRDLDAEREAEAKKQTEIEYEIEKNRLYEEFDDFADSLIEEKMDSGGNNIDVDDIKTIGDLKSIKKEKDEREKEAEIAEKEKKKNREEVEIGTEKGGIFALVRRAIEQLLAFKMHSVRAVGDQAGIFDNPSVNPKGRHVDHKRGVEHDFTVKPAIGGVNFTSLYDSDSRGATPAASPHVANALASKGGGVVR